MGCCMANSFNTFYRHGINLKEKKMSIKNQLQREFKGSNFEIREKLITDTYFTSFLEYVSSPESISKLIEEGYADKRNQLDEYIDFALYHNLITMRNSIIQATDLGLAWVWWAYAPVEGDDWI
jgi:tryptophan--tRNA ligase